MSLFHGFNRDINEEFRLATYEVTLASAFAKLVPQKFLGVKWQDGCQQIPIAVINKITSMSPPTNKTETRAFLSVVGFWRMYIPGYSQIVKPLHEVTQKKNEFTWDPEQRKAFEQI
ncbi:hypothetical protein llap_5396 [Limosa lapponica baueri]|uniref:Reverse transcriptase/retrotransposon-derived protein RNase H-like domain-containing protein n=1 Tax=Limosa lapponica baueri TaxID=1758121 RepID=A0A2I0UE55_LIMLA|nr:hypothetical protein llap_5396 [Limosa lapponica baueri]